MKKALFAGSFDPVTNGHLWMLEQCAHLFDEVVVAVTGNADKKYTFSLDTRFTLLKEVIMHLPNVKVTSFQNQFTADYARSINASFLIRGIRNHVEFEFEKTVRHINAEVYPQLTSIFLIPPKEFGETASSIIKGWIGCEGWEVLVKRHVPAAVFAKIQVWWQEQSQDYHAK